MRDYVDFVQRNEQGFFPFTLLDGDLSSLDNDHDWIDEMNSKVILVKVPTRYSREEILDWALTDLAHFPIIEATYDPDSSEFINLEGYPEVLHNNHLTWLEKSIWESPSIPGEYLINFDPKTYNAFVHGLNHAEEIPRGYYREVFENRGWILPKWKLQAYIRLVNGD